MQNQHYLRSISVEALAALGALDTAYVRPIEDAEGTVRFGIFSASGTCLGMAETRELAFLSARQNDLDVVSVH